jgi:hypothetical protein
MGAAAAVDEKLWRSAAGELVFPFTTVATHLLAGRHSPTDYTSITSS